MPRTSSLLIPIGNISCSLDNNKEQIIETVTVKIINRYYFKEGEYQYKMNLDKEIKDATNLLNNPKKHQQLLN